MLTTVFGIILAAILLKYWREGLGIVWFLIKLILVALCVFELFVDPKTTLELALMLYGYYLVYRFIIAIWHISGGMPTKYAFLTMLPKFIQKQYLLS